MAEGTVTPEANVAPPMVDAFPQAGGEVPKKTLLDKLKNLLSFFKRKKASQSETVKSPTEVGQGEIDKNDKQWAASSETTFPAPTAPPQEISTFPGSPQLDQEMREKTPGYKAPPSSESIESLVNKMHQDLQADKTAEEATGSAQSTGQQPETPEEKAA